MEFLLSLVSCYGRAASGGGEAGVRRGPPEEGRIPSRQVKRARSRQGEWRPSLCSIVEDRVVVPERVRGGEGKAMARVSPAHAGRRSSSGSPARVHVRGHSDQYGGVSVTMAIPAFSPTPFMF